MSQSCGSCKHFQRMKNLKHATGLCVLFDARTNTDHGSKCEKYKRIKFYRKAELLNHDLCCDLI